MDNIPDRVWAGAVVPKRHARRAVTRNLLKRQIREALRRHEQALPRGLWLVRLRGPFSPAQFVSARSGDLAGAVRRELEALLAQAPLAQGGAASPPRTGRRRGGPSGRIG